ncbi:hypothetical protein [Microtetraspora sp. NBRC 13810]|uniref:hypothetical protein n=1 Tax=Microtetraspora sp. NBRC 13810 TaxID=3030990 RepID=UPI0025576B89|nr:hypothetical protein [Microtetraspora sp. NBRC 13810]
MTGMLVGAVFGAVFVMVNSSAPLSLVIGILFRVLAVLALAGVAAMWYHAGRRLGHAGAELVAAALGAGRRFGGGYVVVVAGEAIALFGGLAALSAVRAPEQVDVAWVALVAGVHFVALGPIWKQVGVIVPGAILTVLALAGFVMSVTPAIDWVPFVSGTLSGMTLLAGCVTYAWLGFSSIAAPAPAAVQDHEAQAPAAPVHEAHAPAAPVREA